jgi:hypothetical protein
MIETLGRHSRTAYIWVRSQILYVTSVMDKLALVCFCLSTSGFPPQSHSTTAPDPSTQCYSDQVDDLGKCEELLTKQGSFEYGQMFDRQLILHRLYSSNLQNMN